MNDERRGIGAIGDIALGRIGLWLSQDENRLWLEPTEVGTGVGHRVESFDTSGPSK